MAQDTIERPRQRERQRLRDFQERLAKRLAEARTGGVRNNRLGLQIGTRLFLIDLEEAGEIVPMPVMTPVPLTQPWFKGLANMRGNLVSVVDFNMFCGDGATALDRDSRAMAFGSKLGFNAAILITRMLGLKNVGEFQAQSGADNGQVWLGRRYADADGRVWQELKLRQLAKDERFLHAGI
jgi:twitching motility protein PilI